MVATLGPSVELVLVAAVVVLELVLMAAAVVLELVLMTVAVVLLLVILVAIAGCEMLWGVSIVRPGWLLV